MKSLNHFATTALVTLATSLTLTGCFGSGTFPDASANPVQTPLGNIQGSDYGGHAPLVGAHVYVLQPSVTTPTATSQQTASFNAYAARATSLLSATYSNNGANYPATTANTSDAGVPAGWYYQTTDLTGAFNITGDYTCTAGIPVYLYLYGGMPQYPSANNTYSIANVVWSGSSNPYTVTMTITTNTAQNLENAYTGEYLTVNGGLTGAGGTPLNGTVQIVVAGSTAAGTGLTTTQFSFQYAAALPSGVVIGTNYPQTGTNQVTFDPTFNTAVVNLAVLGNCPSTGTLAYNATTNPTGVKYVYVNEVATVAAAYAFRPFTFTPQAGSAGYQTDCTETYNGGTVYDWNNATCIGTSSTNLAGLQNAANIAAQLYDIQGSNISTVYAGEGHIARANTTNGNGIIPQANIDELGNILAACVDSNNGSTVVGTSGGYTGGGAYTGISSQCNTLFSTATSNGVLSTASSGAGVQPFDIAQAAINIARHPGGPPSGSGSSAATFMSNLYGLPTGNVPFGPYLTTQPNDFSIGIYYPSSLNGSYGNTAESVAIDNIGNAWVTAQNGVSPAYLYEMSPVGVRSNITSQSNYIYGYVTIDTNQNAWSGAATDTISGSPGAYGFTYVKKTGTTSSGTTYPNPYTYNAAAVNNNKLESYTYAAAGNSAGNVYFGNNGTYSSNNLSGRPNDYIETLSGAATTPTVTGTESAQIPTFTSSDGGITHMAMQPTSTSAYIDYNNSDGAAKAYLGSVVLSSGANNYTEITPSTTGCTGLTDPEQMAVTRNGDGLFPDFHNGGGTINTATSSLYFLTSLTSGSPGTCSQISGATYSVGLNSPFGVTIDGNDFAYITNRGNGNGTTISILDMRSATSTVTGVSPSTGIQPSYVPSGGSLTSELSGPLNIAAGPSGELWITNPAGNSLVEIIGLAYPTSTPLAYAAQIVANNYSVGTVGLRP
jgi:hypothetical protein